jgi:hypothetical protein
MEWSARIQRRWKAVLTGACCMLFPVLASSAGAASSASDPSGDVLSCSGECSNYDQDLSSIGLAVDGSNLVVTISQYGVDGMGPFQSALPLYWPQVDLYTTSPDPTSAPEWSFQTTQPIDFGIHDRFDASQVPVDRMELIHFTPGTPYYSYLPPIETHVPYTFLTSSSVEYTVPLAQLGNPSGIRARAWQTGTGDTGSHKIVDVAPDAGVVGVGTPGGPGPGSGAPAVASPGAPTGKRAAAIKKCHKKPKKSRKACLKKAKKRPL